MIAIARLIRSSSDTARGPCELLQQRLLLRVGFGFLARRFRGFFGFGECELLHEILRRW